jgi:hypothetical protein
MIKSKFIIASLAAAATLLSNSDAAVVDLGSNGSGSLNGALFQVASIHPAGTGVFNPFLTIQNSPWEQGYNSGTGNFDTKREPQWNHEIKFSDLQVTTINNIQYFGFAVDVNEPNGGNRAGISLNGLSVWTSATIRTSNSVDANGFFNGSLGTLRYDLGGGNSVLYDDQHRGSGESDINIYIPVSFFAGTNANDFIYMYQRWGNTDSSEGGFEETSLIRGITPVPELNALFPIVGLMVAVGSTHILRRRKTAQMSE